MSEIDVIKENIQYEQFLRESSTNHVLKGEYLIRDSYPDMKEVLGVEAKANITGKEVLGDKVTVEGQLNYTVFYIPKEEVMEEGDIATVHSVSFSEKFANFLEVGSEEQKLACEVECQIEHIEASLMNERKVGIDGILTLEWVLYKQGEFEYVKDIEGKQDIKVLKKQEVLNKKKGEKDVELIGKSMMKVTMDKPEIAQVLKCELNIHKKELKLAEDKVYVGCYCKIEVVYKGKDKNELVVLNDDIYLSKEEEIVGVSPEMMGTLHLCIKNHEVTINTDDLGESRVCNVEFILNGKVKVFSEDKVDFIKDCYSPTTNIELKKQDYQIGITQKPVSSEVVVKDNIYLPKQDIKVEQILSTNSSAMITDKTVEADKIKAEGIVKCSILYKTDNQESSYGIAIGEIPFSAVIDSNGAKAGMDAILKANIEMLDANIEGNTIGIRANVLLNAKVCFKVNKEWLTEIAEVEGEPKTKKASVIIYVVGEGDTLWELAKKYNTVSEDIVKLNDVDPEIELKPGQKLIIPGRAIF